VVESRGHRSERCLEIAGGCLEKTNETAHRFGGAFKSRVNSKVRLEHFDIVPRSDLNHNSSFLFRRRCPGVRRGEGRQKHVGGLVSRSPHLWRVKKLTGRDSRDGERDAPRGPCVTLVVKGGARGDRRRGSG
jgi:hypothetical protein